MDKIKWLYDKQTKQFYEKGAYKIPFFWIQEFPRRKYNRFELRGGPAGDMSAYFRKLSSAKTVANLLRNG